MPHLLRLKIPLRFPPSKPISNRDSSAARRRSLAYLNKRAKELLSLDNDLSHRVARGRDKSCAIRTRGERPRSIVGEASLNAVLKNERGQRPVRLQPIVLGSTVRILLPPTSVRGNGGSGVRNADEIFRKRKRSCGVGNIIRLQGSGVDEEKIAAGSPLKPWSVHDSPGPAAEAYVSSV